MPFPIFRRDHLRSTSGIICGSGSFAVQFGDHFWSGDHLRSGIICGAVQRSSCSFLPAITRAIDCRKSNFKFGIPLVCRYHQPKFASACANQLTGQRHTFQTQIFLIKDFLTFRILSNTVIEKPKYRVSVSQNRFEVPEITCRISYS